MEVIDLAWWKLGLAALLVLALAATAYLGRLGITRSLLVAAIRTVIQLALIGLVLEALFASSAFYWIALLAAVMLLVAGREVVARQSRRLKGGWAFGIGTGAMFVSSFTVTVLALAVVIGPEPWYTPQYAIPLLGMMLGNTMTGVSLALDRLLAEADNGRARIEARLALGHTFREAMQEPLKSAMRAGLIPTVNGMAAAGLVSLPGMMTGQILAGVDPVEAVKYQLLVMFLIGGGTALGVFCAVMIGLRRLTDTRQRLRLDRLRVE